jgi:hypothetical protein
MVQPARIDNPTAVLPKPIDWDDQQNGHCAALPVKIETIGGVPYMRSAWDIEATEALQLLCGARLVLGVAGHRHPVVQMKVEDLPVDFQPGYTVRRITSLGGCLCARVETLMPRPDGMAQMIYCEEPITGEGMAITVGRAIDRIDDLARKNGLID